MIIFLKVLESVRAKATERSIYRRQKEKYKKQLGGAGIRQRNIEALSKVEACLLLWNGN